MLNYVLICILRTRYTLKTYTWEMSNPSKDSHPQSLHYDVMYLETLYSINVKILYLVISFSLKIKPWFRSPNILLFYQWNKKGRNSGNGKTHLNSFWCYYADNIARCFYMLLCILMYALFKYKFTPLLNFCFNYLYVWVSECESIYKCRCPWGQRC